MPRYSAPYSSLVDRLVEVETILSIAKGFERKDAMLHAKKINALCRGAIVLLSSHIEGYIKELGELTLDRIHSRGICRSRVSQMVAFYVSRDRLYEIKDTSDTIKLAEKVVDFFDTEFEFWKQKGPYPVPLPEDLFNKSFASPSFDKISSYVGRFGYSAFKHDIAKSLKAEFQTSKNMIDHIVDVRNKIAHGDSSISKTPGDLFTAMEIVRKFCRIVDDLFASWCRKNLCSIR